MNKFRLGTTLSLSLSAIAISGCLLATSCKSGNDEKDKLIISGSNTITTYVNEYHEEDYQAIDTKNEKAIISDWTISNSQYSDKFTLNKTHNNTIAQLVWSSSAFSTPINFDLTIQCNSQELNLNKSKTIHFEVLPSIISVTSINIYGSTTLTGQKDVQGTSNYVVIDNNGHKVYGGTWSIIDQSGSATINISNGVITWEDANSGTTTFKIKYVKDNLEGVSDLIILTINDSVPPTPTLIDVWGSQELTGVGGYSGLSDYTATDNNGHILSGVSWSISSSTATGVSISSNGQINWTDKATSGNFIINCHKDGLTDGTLDVSLTINNPTPPGPGPMPTSCLEISSDGKICYGLKAGVDLSLYNEIDIPEGVETIEFNAFDSKISSGYEYKLNLPNSLINIGDNAFNNCVGIEELNLGNGVRNIEDYAFNGLSRIRFLNIPNSVTNIGSKAFAGMTDVVNLNDNSNCESYGTNVFKGTTSFSSLVTSNYVVSDPHEWSIFGEHFKRSDIALQIHKVGSSQILGNGQPFDENNAIVSVAIDEGITEIGDCFFEWCINLKDVSLPQSLNKIGSDAFFNCVKLFNINLPSNLTYIGSTAFCSCGSLLNISLPCVSSLGAFAFSGCGNLLSIDLSMVNSCEFDSSFIDESSSPQTDTFQNCPISEIILGNRTQEPQWTISHGETTAKIYTFRNIATSGNIIVSGSWTNKSTILSFMEQWGLYNSGWHVNGV